MNIRTIIINTAIEAMERSADAHELDRDPEATVEARNRAHARALRKRSMVLVLRKQVGDSPASIEDARKWVNYHLTALGR